jgi:hypothetical protein
VSELGWGVIRTSEIREVAANGWSLSARNRDNLTVVSMTGSEGLDELVYLCPDCREVEIVEEFHADGTVTGCDGREIDPRLPRVCNNCLQRYTDPRAFAREMGLPLWEAT